jgi:hypothetical protein
VAAFLFESKLTHVHWSRTGNFSTVKNYFEQTTATRLGIDLSFFFMNTPGCAGVKGQDSMDFRRAKIRPVW